MKPFVVACVSFGRLSSMVFFVCIELLASGVPSVLFCSWTAANFTSAFSWHNVYYAAESKNNVDFL